MSMMLKLPKTLRFAATLLFATNILLTAPAAAVTLANSATGSTISAFGTPDTLTYGQVFTAPVTGTLDSFTLHLVSGVGNIVGAVGTWNGTASYGFGFGSPMTLLSSAPTSSSAGANIFETGGTQVTAGSRYVAFISAFGLNNPFATTHMRMGTAVDNVHYFVFNNETDPFGNPSWNYFSNFGTALFEAKFTEGQGVAPVPLPAAGWLLLAGLGALIGVRRRQMRA